jgi:hypothetical protein
MPKRGWASLARVVKRADPRLGHVQRSHPQLSLLRSPALVVTWWFSDSRIMDEFLFATGQIMMLMKPTRGKEKKNSNASTVLSLKRESSNRVGGLLDYFF